MKKSQKTAILATLVISAITFGGLNVNAAAWSTTNPIITEDTAISNETVTNNTVSAFGSAVYFTGDNISKATTVSIDNSSITGNKASNSSSWSAGGAILANGKDSKGKQMTLTITGGEITNNSVNSSANEADGGAIFAKGTNVTLKNVTKISNNTATSTSSTHDGLGGAIYIDSVENDTDGNLPGKLTISVDGGRNLSYTGNTVTGSTTSEDTYGSVTSGSTGGFLYLDRNTQATFDIAQDSSLTIGEEGAPVGTDDIASSRPLAGSKDSVDSLTKTGAGVLTVNGVLDNYVGDVNVDAGTMNVTQKWTTGDDITVANGATLNAADLVLQDEPTSITYKSSNGGTFTRFLKNITDSGVDVKEGGTVTANSITAGKDTTVNVDGELTTGSATIQDGGTFKSGSDATVTMDDATFDNGAFVELQGTTNINNSLANNAQNAKLGTLNLASGAKLSGSGKATRVTLTPTNVTWNKPIEINGGIDAETAEVKTDNLSLTNDGSLRVGSNSQMVLMKVQGTGDKADGFDKKNVDPTPRNVTFGSTLQGQAAAGVDDDGNVVLNATISNNAQPQTHKAVMAQDASLTTVTGGFDFLAQAMDGMTESGVYGIASVGGGEHKYDTGSHIKTNAWHAVAGIGVKNAAESGSATEYGAFYDYGDGHYRTFSDGRGDGKTIYKGAGLFGKYTFDNQMYVEGSFRAGHVKNTASDIFHDALGNKYGLRLSSNYNAFHVGIGKVLDVGSSDTLDVYGKFFHTHIGSDSFEAGGHYDIDSVDSNILRVGTRWNHKAGAWTHYLGVAYEYEFDGEAKGTADGAHIESADIGGSSVRFELGTKVETGKWVIGFNADAYAGQHKGYDGTISAGLKF